MVRKTNVKYRMKLKCDNVHCNCRVRVDKGVFRVICDRAVLFYITRDFKNHELCKIKQLDHISQAKLN